MASKPASSDAGIESSARLGRRRFEVGRTFAHLKQMRRIAARCDRRADIYHALFTPGCALLTFNQFARSC